MNKLIALQQLVKRRKLIFLGFALVMLLPNFVLAQKNLLQLKNQQRVNRQPFIKSANRQAVMRDAGHGGIGSKALGEDSLMKKQVVLDIAYPVKRLTNQHPTINAHLTQESDFFIALYQRVQITHQHGASLFMSIQADGYHTPSVQGASVLALSNCGPSFAIAPHLAQRNDDIDKVGDVQIQRHYQYLSPFLFDLLKINTIIKSPYLGQHLLKAIRTIHRLHSGQTEQAAFAVLKSTSISSVLLETSLITNPTEEQLFDSSKLRKRIVTAIS